MDFATVPKFHLLDTFPREIRDKIFEYMVEDKLEVYRPPFPRILSARNILGTDPSDATSIILSSPWIMHAEQYGAEYLAVFVRQVVLEVDTRCQWAGAGSQGVSTDGLDWPGRRSTNLYGVEALEEILDLINKQFESINRSVGIGTTDKALLWYLKGIILSYHYRDPFSFFEVGFGNWDDRSFPPEHHLRRPLTTLRRCHDEYHVQSTRLSMNISYGQPYRAIRACHEALDHHESDPLEAFSLSCLDPIRAQIYPTDYAASVAAIDKAIEIMRMAVEEVLGKLRAHYPQPQNLVHIQTLEDMLDRDLASLRRRHLKVIEQATEFWKMQDGMYELADQFKIVETWESEY